MKAFLTITLLTAMTHLIGSACLFGVVGGLTGFLGSPLLAFFGWFFLIPEALVVLTQFGLLNSARRLAYWRTWLLTVPASTLLMVTVGPKEIGDEVKWALGYGLGTMTAATCSLLAVRWAKFVPVCIESDTNGVVNNT